MIQTILVDDEKLSLIPMIEKLKQYNEIDIVKAYSDPNQVLSDMKDIHFNVAFLDIEMKKIDGLTLAKEIHLINPNVQIVFVTAHSEYAIHAFELDSTDYLLKPVTTRRLDKTIHRLKQNLNRIANQPLDSTPTNQLIVKTFGELLIYYNDKPVSFKTAKVKELFAFLITYRNTYIHRDIIIEKLWPNHDYKKAKIHLHTCLSHLRKLLEQMNQAGTIEFKDQHYCLNLRISFCDAFEIDDVLKGLDSVNDSNISIFEKIANLYKDPYLELNGYEWSYEKSQEYHQKIMLVLNKIINYYQGKDLHKSLFYLSMQRKVEPYLDENIKKSMEILMKQNNRSEAIKIYLDYCNLISNDLGLEPSISIRKIYDSLVSG